MEMTHGYLLVIGVDVSKAKLDIAWGPDGKLYISTNNDDVGHDTVNNYIWDSVAKSLSERDGEYYSGLAWVGSQLYGSRALAGTSTGKIFELTVTGTSFVEGTLVATMPNGVTIGDLSTAVPEPGTLCILGVGGIIFLWKRRK